MEELSKKIETLEDFLFDASFREWVFTKEPSIAAYWSAWTLQHPEKQDLFNLAFHILENLYMKNQHISEDEVKREIEKILLKIKEGEAEEFAPPKVRVITSFFRYWKAVAAAAVIITGGLYFYNTSQRKSADTYEAFANKSSSNSQEYINGADSSLSVTLADGSTVILYAKTRLAFAVTEDKREAYMDGKAFFQVTKNPSRPFIVYTNKVVTKVLGTSFYVDAYPASNAVSVVVKTGKVSVYKRADFTGAASKPYKLEGTLLTPNQKIVFEPEKNVLTRSLIEEPLAIVSSGSPSFDFNETPVKEVFEKIQGEYGVHILFDEEVFKNCSLTASFAKESFYDKLNIIVKAINASYELVDGNIVISSSKGCK
ncbi:MAG: FecR family protein [Bacteroidota bacterium]